MATDIIARGMSRQAGNAAASTYAAAKMRPISWMGTLAFSGASNGTNTWANSQIRYPIVVPASSFVLKYANMVQDGTPAATGEQSVVANQTQMQVRALALKLFATGTFSATSATGASLSAGFAYPSLIGKFIQVQNGTNGLQSQYITAHTGNGITVASWPGGTPAVGATYAIYDTAPVTFSGSRTLLLDSGAVVTSDPVAMSVAAGDIVWIITNCYNGNTTGVWSGPAMHANFNYPGIFEWTNTGTSTNMDATIPNALVAFSASANSTPMGPLGLWAYVPQGNVPSVNGVGDSILAGTGPANDVNNGFNLVQRWNVILGYPGWTGGIPGDTTVGMSQPRNGRLRRMLGSQAQYVICEIGVNDAANGISLADSKAALGKIWAGLAADGAKVIQRVPTPNSAASTDGFTTIGSQTAGANNASTQALNAWLRDTGPTGAKAQYSSVLWMVFDPNKTAEPYIGAGIWQPDPQVGATLTVASASGSAIFVSGTPFSSGVLLDVSNNPDKYQVMITSGAGTFGGNTPIQNSPKNAPIQNVLSGNRINTYTMTTAPSAGDTVAIFPLLVTDGLHPQRYEIERELAQFRVQILPFMKALV